MRNVAVFVAHVPVDIWVETVRSKLVFVPCQTLVLGRLTHLYAIDIKPVHIELLFKTLFLAEVGGQFPAYHSVCVHHFRTRFVI